MLDINIQPGYVAPCEYSLGGDNTVPRRYKMRNLRIALTVLVVFWTLGVSHAEAEKSKSWTSATPLRSTLADLSSVIQILKEESLLRNLASF